MITYQKITHNNSLLEHYHFSSSHFSCKIFPNLGGSMQELKFEGITIIKGLATNDKGINHYKTHFNSALLFPFPNRVNKGSYNFEKESHQLPINETVYHNALHGLVYDKSFNVEYLDSQKISLKYTHHKSPGFPFPFELSITYSFFEKGVSIDFNVLNKGTLSFPFGIGWHPYFQLDSYKNCEISLEAEKEYLTNEQQIPNGTIAFDQSKIDLENVQLDTAYNLMGEKVILQSPQYQLTLGVPKNGFLQIFTPALRNSVAIEPMSCIADSFNNGVGKKIIKPGRNWTWDLRLDFKKLSPKIKD